MHKREKKKIAILGCVIICPFLMLLTMVSKKIIF